HQGVHRLLPCIYDFRTLVAKRRRFLLTRLLLRLGSFFRRTRSGLRASCCRRMRRSLRARRRFRPWRRFWTRSRLRMRRSGGMRRRLRTGCSRLAGLSGRTGHLRLGCFVLGRSGCRCLIRGRFIFGRPRCRCFIRRCLVLAGLVLLSLACSRLILGRASFSSLGFSSLVFSSLVLGRLVLGWLARSCLILGRRSLVRSSSSLSRYHSLAAKLARLRRRSDCRSTLIHRCQERVIGARGPHVLGLHCSCRYVALVRGCLLGRGGAGANSTSATVVADVVYSRGVDNGLVVNIGNVHATHVVHRGVVEEGAVVPISASIAHPAIAEAVVDAAVEADLRAPIPAIPGKGIAAPTPIARSPEQASFRRLDPGTGHPEVAFVAIRPVAGRPHIADRGNHRLLIHGQRGRSDHDRHAELSEQTGRYGQNQDCQQKKTGGTHVESPCQIILRLPGSTLLLRAAWIEGDGSDARMPRIRLPSLCNTTHFSKMHPKESGASPETNGLAPAIAKFARSWCYSVTLITRFTPGYIGLHR